jgi:hypothetical protein
MVQRSSVLCSVLDSLAMLCQLLRLLCGMRETIIRNHQHSLYGELVACLKILQDYSLGRDSELIVTNDEEESWRVHVVVDVQTVEVQGMLQMKSPEDTCRHDPSYSRMLLAA